MPDASDVPDEALSSSSSDVASSESLPPPPVGYGGLDQPPVAEVPDASDVPDEALSSSSSDVASSESLPQPPVGYGGLDQPPALLSPPPAVADDSPAPFEHNRPDPEVGKPDQTPSSSRILQLGVLLLVIVVAVTATLVISNALSDTDGNSVATGGAVNDSGDEATP